jgi:hypothetical protein
MDSPKASCGKRLMQKLPLDEKLSLFELKKYFPLFFFPESDMLQQSRSGRRIKKSTKLIDFTSPDDIEAKKAKKMAAQSRKLVSTSI